MLGIVDKRLHEVTQEYYNKIVVKLQGFSFNDIAKMQLLQYL